MISSVNILFTKLPSDVTIHRYTKAIRTENLTGVLSLIEFVTDTARDGGIFYYAEDEGELFKYR